MSDTSSSPSFDSLLPTGRERFLAQVMVHTLTEGWATPQDFLRHFPPQKLIESLADAEELRVNLLVKAAKVHQKAAAKKSAKVVSSRRCPAPGWPASRHSPTSSRTGGPTSIISARGCASAAPRAAGKGAPRRPGWSCRWRLESAAVVLSVEPRQQRGRSPEAPPAAARPVPVAFRTRPAWLAPARSG